MMEYQKQHPEMRKMSMDEINARNRATAEAYGEDIIAECLIEECSELIQAVSKYRRACGNGKPTKVSVQKARENLAEEIADVEASIYMYRYLLNITDEELNKWYEMKSVPQHQA